jgi:hypothetical protein
MRKEYHVNIKKEKKVLEDALIAYSLKLKIQAFGYLKRI